MKKIQLPVTAFMLFLTACTQAASFDCAKAAAPIEKLICSDEITSKLDSDLAGAYKVAMEKTDNKDALKQQQRTWLKEKRKACKDAACLTQVYTARIAELSFASSVVDVDNKIDTSVNPQNNYASKFHSKPIFKLVKGAQYEVCRVFADYLNSDYYKKGDCTINDYPADIRLKSVPYKKANIIDYQDFFISELEKRASPEKKEAAIKGLKHEHSSGMIGAWLADVSIKNDNSKDVVLITKKYVSKEQYCRSLGGRMDRLVNKKIDNSLWDGPLTEPFMFDGIAFLLYAETGGEETYSITEPRSSDLKFYRENQFYHGEISTVEVCELYSVGK